MQNKDDLLGYARRYLELGLAPIPCHAPVADRKCSCRLGLECVSPGKHPAVPWQRFQKKPIDDDQLLVWFGDGGIYANRNIGIVTGAISGNVFVIDVDCGPGKQGQDTLEELQRRFDDLPPTMQAKTGNNGKHLFYRAPQGVRIVTDKNVLGHGVDVRGEGGFVVAAPSVHASGNHYKCDFDEIAQAPSWLLDLVIEGAHHESHGRGIQERSTGNNPFKATDGREGVMVRTILSTICSHFRDNGSLPTLDELIETGFPSYCEKVKARSESLEADGRGISLFKIRAGYQLHRAARGDLRVLQTIKEEAQGAKRDGTVSQMLSSPKPAAKNPPEPDEFEAAEAAAVKIEEKHLKITDWAVERYKGDPPEVQWLIQGVVPQGIPMLLAAIGGLGKSFLSLDLALKVAGGGSKWDDEAQLALGGKVVGFGRVVFLTAEDSASAIHRRLDGLKQAELREKAKQNLFVVPLPDAGGAFPFISEDSQGLHHTPGYVELRSQLLELSPISLIIFDPLQAFVHADVTADPAAAQFWWSTMAELCAATGATILVSHHMRKEGSFSIKRPADARQAIRGTTALVDGARLVYGIWSLPENEEADICKLLEVEPGQNNVACGAVVKTNEFADMDIRTFKRSETGLLVDCTAQVEELVVEASSLNATQERSIFDEVQKRWAAGAPFNPNVRGRNNSFPFWVTESYGLPKKVSEKKMLEWMNRGRLIASAHEKTKQPGLRVGEAGASSYSKGVRNDD